MKKLYQTPSSPRHKLYHGPDLSMRRDFRERMVHVFNKKQASAGVSRRVNWALA